MNGTTTDFPVAVALSPRDGMLLKDGRGWSTSESGRAGTFAWPAASTVRGAITAALGHTGEDERGRPLSADEWLDLSQSIRVDAVLPLCDSPDRPDGWSRLWPAPREAVSFPQRDAVRRLAPSRPGAGRPLVLTRGAESAAIESLWHPRLGDVEEKPDAPAAWWTEDALIDWLCGREVSRRAARAVLGPPSRVQTHVSIGAAGAATEGGLFTATVIEPVSRDVADDDASRWTRWSLAAIGEGFEPDVVRGRTVRLGGDGRFATCAPLSRDFTAVPRPIVEAFQAGSRGLRLVLAGDASFAGGWRPAFLAPRDGRFVGELPGVGPVVLRAACVGRPVAVSGWAMAARGKGRQGAPKPTRRLVPAGSVFFLEKVSGEPFTANDAERLWLRAVGEPVHGADPVGAMVPGVWNPDDVEGGNEA